MHAWGIFPLQQHIGHLFKMYLPFNSVTDTALQFLPRPHSGKLHIFCHSSAPFLPAVRHQYQPAPVPELWSFFQKVHQRPLPYKNMAVVPHLTTQNVTNHRIIERYIAAVIITRLLIALNFWGSLLHTDGACSHFGITQHPSWVIQTQMDGSESVRSHLVWPSLHVSVSLAWPRVIESHIL